jgi:sugar phosphate isomerase/epimerase
MKDIDRPAFKVHLDYCNMLNSIERYRHASAFITHCFDLLGEHIVSVHAKDALITQGALPVNINEVQPGAGSLDLSLVTALAHGLGEDIPVFVEHLDTHEQYMQAAAVMREAAKKAGVPVK